VQVKTNIEILCVFARNLEKQNRQVPKNAPKGIDKSHNGKTPQNPK
jgi:hypothetical protein